MIEEHGDDAYKYDTEIKIDSGLGKIMAIIVMALLFSLKIILPK